LTGPALDAPALWGCEMARYRKRPLEIEAEQWFPDKQVQGVYWNNRYQKFYVVTIHDQDAYLDPGDWVTGESDGEHHYPCKPDEFERIYEAV
jgi:hypothetical protein